MTPCRFVPVRSGQVHHVRYNSNRRDKEKMKIILLNIIIDIYFLYTDMLLDILPYVRMEL